MRLTRHNSLDGSLGWRAIGRLEAGQSQTVVARWLKVARKWSLVYGINSKLGVLPPGRSAKVTREPRHRHVIATGH
ncbi:hypothetical protein TNCV_233461 [Trichonephila clavipes]|nr:hypothetical protein TNCV_233461 [Trichonephila clavipes]